MQKKQNLLAKNFRTQVFAILLILLGSLSVQQVKAQSTNNPEITNITPSILRAEGGTEVVISGKNFSPDSIVVLGGEVVKNPVINGSEIRFQAPSQSLVGAKTLTVISSKSIAQRELRVIDRSVSGISVGEMTTIAGGLATTGSGELASRVHFSTDNQSLLLDNQGNLLVIERYPGKIQQIDTTSGVVTTVAGLGNSKQDGDLAVLSRVQPQASTVDKAGNIFFADGLTNTVKKIDVNTKTIKIVAGGKLGVPSGDGGLATDASLGNIVSGIAIDQNNNLFLVSRNVDLKTGDSTSTIRRVDGKTGVITRFAGNGQEEFSGDGGPAINAGIGVFSIAIDFAGNLLVVDSANHRIRRIDVATGVITTIAGNGKDPFQLGNNTSIDGKPATDVAISPLSIVLDKDGNLLFQDRGLIKLDIKTGLLSVLPTKPLEGENGVSMSGMFTLNNSGNIVFVSEGRILERLSTGQLKLVTGTKLFNFTEDTTTPAISSNLGFLNSITSNIGGDLFFTDVKNLYVRKIDTRTGMITTIAGSGPSNFFFGGGGDGKPATSSSVSIAPYSAKLDSIGNLYIADPIGERVRRVDVLSNIISTFAGNSSDKINGDGGLASNAGIGGVQDITFDPQGNFFISGNNYIRRVDAKTKIITTIAGNGKATFSGNGVTSTNATGSFASITSDSKGNLFVADIGSVEKFNSHIVRRIDAGTGVITTIAGNGRSDFSGENGQAIDAGLGEVTNMVVAENGDLFIGAYDFITNDNVLTDLKYDVRVWRVDSKTGIISVVASSSSQNASSNLNGLPSISLDQNGNLLIAGQSFLEGIYDVKVLKLSDKVKTSSEVFINTASYQKSLLTVRGGGFGNSLTVKINGKDVTKQMTNQNSQEIMLKGSRKELNVQKTTNQIIVTNSDGIIATVVF